MRLNLSHKGVLIASVTIDPARCQDENYLRVMRELLLQKSSKLVTMLRLQPSYSLEVSPAIATILFHNGEKERQQLDHGQPVDTVFFQLFSTQCGKVVFSAN